MTIEMVERRQVALEWDMGWFCYECDRLNHWKTKAYIINNKPLCRVCAEKVLNQHNSRR